MPSRLDGFQLGSTDVVAAALPAGPELAEVLAACWDAGAALFPVDPRLPAPVVDGLLRRARPTVVLDDAGARRVDGDASTPGTGAIVATSGTTGEPRLVVLSRDAITAAVRGSADRLGAAAAEPWLLCIPPAHIGGLLVLFRGLLLGVRVITHDAFSVERFTAERAVRCVSLVPTLLHRLVDAQVDLRALGAVLVGGDSLTPALAARARGLGAVVVHTYGQTQSCGGVVYDGVPLPGVSVDIDASGEVLLGGPTVMTGYRGDASATAAAFTDGGLLRTGDAGELDAGGGLRVNGRLDDVIVTGGEKVSPAAVEAALRSHPRVGEVAVVGESDERWGERVVAVVVAADAATPPVLAELRDWVRDRLPAYAAPRDVVVVERLPLTVAGKVRREQLRTLLAERRAAAPMP